MRAGKKHPIRGFLAGLLLGLSVAQVVIVFNVIALGTATPWIVVLACIVFGVLWSLVGPARRHRTKGTKAQPEPPASVGSAAAAKPAASSVESATPSAGTEPSSEGETPPKD